jgi:tetratricopeptide (TPR) repeat protein
MTDANLSLSLAQRVDAECDRFESEWRAGCQPRIEDYLAAAPATDRAVLLGALLDVERELRFGAEQETEVESFQGTSPDQAAQKPTWPAVAGHEVLGELGRGGMGVVYLARQPGLDRLVALKVILSGAHADEAERARFRREAQTLARLQHPGVVQVFEAGEHDGNPYLVLEYVPGGSLADRLDGTPLPARQVALLVRTLAQAMEAAHRAGVVHRDLKPGNVLLAACGLAGSASDAPAKPQAAEAAVDFIPKITDFGLARCLDAQTVPTQSGVVVGTPSYMAPEQARGSKDVGPAADIYALGAILYELLTGRPPFRGPTPLETVLQVLDDDPVPLRLLLPRLPRDLETICMKCLHKDPARRYASAGELADDLGRFLSGEPIRARPVGRAERVVRWCRRNPLAASLTAALVLVLAAGFVGVTTFWVSARDQRDRAERNFERAFAAIDQSFTQVSSSPELKAKELLPFRKRLLTRAQQQYEGMAAELGDNPRAEEALVRSWIRLAQINRDLGSKAEAEQAARTSVALAEKLVQKAPSSNNRGLLAWAWEERMLAATDAGEQRRATRHVLELREALVREDPENEAALSALARTCYNTGVGHDEAGDHKEAVVWISRARDLLQRKAAAGAVPLEIDELRAQVLLHLARLQAGPRFARFAEALASCQQAIDLWARLAREHPRERRLVLDLSDALDERHLIQGQASRPPADRIASLRQAGSVLDEMLAAGVPSGDTRAQVQIKRARVAYNLSLTYLDNGQSAQARPVLEQTRELCDKLLLTHPDDSELHYWLAVSCTNLAGLNEKEGKGQVLGLLEQARPSMEVAVRAFPAPARRSELGYLLQSLGQEYHRLGQPEKASRLLQEAIERQRQVCAKEPGSVPYRHALAGHYLELAKVQRSRNLLGKAVAAALEARKRYHDSPAELYQVAVELARCMNRVGEGRTTLSPEQEAERQRYASHTLKTLKAAVAAGYRDTDALRKQPAFARLRDRDEFRQLLR